MILVIKRRVKLDHTPDELEAEFTAARWVYNRLLDFEFQHQARLDACSPKLARVGRILARLKRRERWAERTHGWNPPLHADLKKRLEALRLELKKERDASEAWQQAKAWPRENVEPKTCRRHAGESDEAFATRQAKAGRSRREVHALAVYQEKRCHWGSFNAQRKSVEQAVKAVVSARASGMPADLHRARYSDPGRLTAQASQSGFELLDIHNRKLSFRMRLLSGWITLSTYGRGPVPKLPSDFKILVAELCRKRVLHRWEYSLSLTIEGSFSERPKGPGVCGIDMGHRLFEDGSIRALTWYGSDGRKGEVRLPPELRNIQQRIEYTQSRLDRCFNRLNTGFRSRAHYIRYLANCGVMTAQQRAFFSFNTRYEHLVLIDKQRIQDLRRELYIRTIRELRQSYGTFAIDTVDKSVQQLQKGMPHDIPVHRNLVAAYSFTVFAKTQGINCLDITGVDSTRHCPLCRQLHKPTSNLLILCPTLNIKHDQDFSAAYTMLCRGMTALESPDSVTARKRPRKSA